MPVTTDGSTEDIWRGRQVVDKWLEGNQNSISPHMIVGGKIMFYTREWLNMLNFNFYFPQK